MRCVNYIIVKSECCSENEQKDFETDLFEKFFMPVVKGLECPRNIHIIHKNTAICSSVKSRAQALEPFLPCCVPNLTTTTTKIYIYKST